MKLGKFGFRSILRRRSVQTCFQLANRTGLQRGAYESIDEARKKLYSMECQVPPDEFAGFQKVWDADAPRRCHECHCELPAGAPRGQHFCTKHANAGRKVVCSKIVRDRMLERAENDENARRCNGDVVFRNGVYVCKACGQGADIAENLVSIGDQTEETELGKSVKRNAQALQLINNLWGFTFSPDPDHVPAWTKRQRL